MRIFTSAPIRKGDETVVYSEKKHKVGARVSIFSVLSDHFGTKPIASGKVVSACKDEPAAPVTPTKTGKPNASPWRWLYRVKVTKVK